ncbi:MAG TPA: ATPase, T2SS/T4P/T4SS family [Baekduia sp.]|nr:ATPase, T2SS/T4P/T4SS family [Baekduia sp.]
MPPIPGAPVADGAAAPPIPISPPPLAPTPIAPAASNERPADWNGVTPPRRTGGGSARFLTDVIVELGFADRPRVEQAVEAARATGTTPERVLLDQGSLSLENLARAIAERHGLDHLDLSVFHVDMSAANLVNPQAAKRYEAIPVQFVGERGLLIAMADPANVLAVDDIALMTGYEVRVAVASREDIATLISKQSRLDHVAATAEFDFSGDEDSVGEIVDLRESADDAPVIKLVNQIIAQAADQGTSDIHFEPEDGSMRVRFRIDGVLVETMTVPRRMVNGVVSRLKIMSDLDIAERRLPQDGRVGLNLDGRHIDLRVVTLPSVHGENIVIRILDKSNVQFDFEKLGMGEQDAERFQKAFHQAYGAVLVTGPTGSGKSTSLYAAVGELNTPEKNIITIEDPVEYQLEGITQVQVNKKAGLTFANGLRAMMRADPDIIMVGEIRDAETAKIAIEAALTGHLVLSTLHTNDAPTSITRLVEMGIEPFLVASAVDCVIAQRLCRTLCSNCKERTIISAAVLQDHGFRSHVDIEAYDPKGCSRCGGSGYKGRIGLYEVMTINDEIRRLAIERAPADRIAEVAMRDGMRRLRDDGLEKVKQGRTSIAEVARVTGTG